jgi:hypothetical protein
MPRPLCCLAAGGASAYGPRLAGQAGHAVDKLAAAALPAAQLSMHRRHHQALTRARRRGMSFAILYCLEATTTSIDTHLVLAR